MAENDNNATQQEQQRTTDDRELDLMELELYRNTWAEINSALAEIRAMRGNSTPDDPVQLMRSDVATLKKNFAELKEAIINMQKTTDSTAQQVIPPQQNYQRVQMQPAVPLMPYYSTPSYSPIIQLPQ